MAGHTGMAGSAILRRLRQESCQPLVATHSELDLTRQDKVENYLSVVRPDVVIMAPAVSAESWPMTAIWRIFLSRIWRWR